MSYLWLFLIFAAPLATGVVSRDRMVSLTLTRAVLKRESLPFAILGAGKDLLILLLSLLSVSLVSFWGGTGTAVTCLVFLFALLCALTAAFNVVDYYLFSATYQRFSREVAKEFRLRNIFAGLSSRQILLLAGIIGVSALYVAAIFAARPVPGPLVPLVLIGVTVPVCLYCQKTGRIRVAREESHIARLQKARHETISAAVLINCVTVLVTALYMKNLGRPRRVEPYTAEEETFLARLNLPASPKYLYPDEGTPPFRRIILLSLESLAQCMIPVYNDRITPETMLFYRV